MDTSVFEQIASSLTVKSIFSPLGPRVPAEGSASDLEEHFVNEDFDIDSPSPVIDSDGSLVGMLWYENCRSGARAVHEVMEQIDACESLSATASILDAVELFGTKRNHYFYVFHRNEVIGVLYYRDLFKPLGRLAFLALALEIEDEALKLCQSGQIAERCWLSIPDARRRKAMDLYTLRYKREPKQDFCGLIACTNLIDKATMVWKQNLLTPGMQHDVLRFFHELQKIRDACAHPGDRLEIRKERLIPFISSAKCMRSSLLQAMQTHGAGSDRRSVKLSDAI
jgi:hypothetical protein